jgi:hypothetical protein
MARESGATADPGGTLLDSITSNAFSSALIYQGLSSQTPQELQTAGVFTIPTSPVAAPATAGSTASSYGSTDSTSSSDSAASTTGTPSLGLSASTIASLQASVQNAGANPFMLANTYQILNTGDGQSISMMGASSASVGQQVDTTA